MKIEEKNYGWIEPVVKEEDFLFGGGQVDLSKPLQLNGQWLDFIPDGESQILMNYETANCTGFGSTNQAEILLKKKYGKEDSKEYNFSERALGIESGTYPPGNDAGVVYEKIRKVGLAEDSVFPFGGDNVDEYYDKSKITDKVKKSEQEFLNTFTFQHDWVASGKATSPEIIKTALQYSPLGVAIFAFAFDGEFYVRAGKDGDWVVLVGYKLPGLPGLPGSSQTDNKGYWIAYTSYPETNENIIQQNMKEFGLPREKVLTLKKLAWDFGFFWIKRIHIENTIKRQISLLEQIVAIYKKIIDLLFPKTPIPAPKQPTTEVLPPEPTNIPSPTYLSPYLWGSHDEARHSFRVICDESGISFADKNLLTAVLEAEASFIPNTIRTNSNKSRDLGIAQFNNGPLSVPFEQRWWINGKILVSEEEAVKNSEKCVRIFIDQFKKGGLKNWTAFANGSYRNFL